MDKIVVKVLREFLTTKEVDELQGRLWDEHCIICKSELPPINGQQILHIDGTPDGDYPLRILRAYRQNCDCRWGDTTEGTDTENPVLKMMNDNCEQRAKLLDGAIKKLAK